MKSRKELIQQLDSAFHLSTKPAIRKLKDTHIEDPDRSVNWNRQFVIDNNARYAEELDQLKANRKTEIESVINLIVDDYIKDIVDFNITSEGALAIYNWSYMEGCSNGAYGIFDKIDSNIEFLNHLYNLSPKSFRELHISL